MARARSFHGPRWTFGLRNPAPWINWIGVGALLLCIAFWWGFALLIAALNPGG